MRFGGVEAERGVRAPLLLLTCLRGDGVRARVHDHDHDDDRGRDGDRGHGDGDGLHDENLRHGRIPNAHDCRDWRIL